MVKLCQNAMCRGKHSLYLFPDGKLVLKSSKAEIVVPCSALKQVAVRDEWRHYWTAPQWLYIFRSPISLVTNLQIIDVPKDPKKTVLIFLVLDKPVEATGGGKSIDNIVLKASNPPGSQKEPLE